jgi:hypothetical protein
MVLLSTALSGCGGGGSDDLDNVGPLPGAQQFPGGIWEGTTGSGASARSVFGYIDPGSDGKGGDFYFAKGAAGNSGYDSLYGRLSVNVTSVLATNATYFSGQDGKFAQNLNLRGTASANTVTGKTAVISASYSDPIGTLAATGATTPLKLEYSQLNNYAARAELLAGTYRGGSVFGGGWMLTIGAQGAVSGYVGSCSLTGSAGIQSSNSAVYRINLNLLGDEVLCPSTGTGQGGVAVLKFDLTTGLRTGIWVLTRNTAGQPTTYVLNGSADAVNPGQPSPVGQSAAGHWAGTGNAIGNAGTTAVVLPDNAYFFYKRVGTGYDVLYGTLLGGTQSSLFTSSDGVYFANQQPVQNQYSGGVTVNADARTGESFTGSYADPTLGGASTRFVNSPDPVYPYLSPIPQSVAALAGLYRSNAVGFGGASTSLDISPLGALTGTTSDGCELAAQLQPYPASQANLNVYRVESLAYKGLCPQAGAPLQSGMASAQFDASGTRITGVRILAVGQGPSGQRVNTVFLGGKLSSSSISPTGQIATGYWTGTTNATGDTRIAAVVLPNNAYFFYKRMGTGYDVLFGSLFEGGPSTPFSSSDGVYFASLPRQYSGGVAVNATARTGVSFVGNYADPTLAGAKILFDTGPDPEYPYVSPISPSITALAGQYRSNVLGFGGVSTSLDVSPLGVLKGSTLDGCELDAQLDPYPASQANLNLYRVERLVYKGLCPQAGTVLQSGIASAQFEAAGSRVIGLRILTAGQGPSGQRVNTVFLGSKQ